MSEDINEDTVVIGHGMAGQRFLASLVSAGYAGRITVIGAEPEPAYNRILLSPLLAGEIAGEQLPLAGAEWYRRHGVRCHNGDGVHRIDRAGQRVITRDGHAFRYDRLVIATGSRPAPLGIEGEDLDGVTSFRNLADVARLDRAASGGGDAVVIGGGFLGLEAAEGLRKQGMTVSLAHRGPCPLTRQLDPVAGGMLADTLRARGLDLVLNARPARLLGEHRVAGLELDDGRTLPADLVVIAAGIIPNSELGETAGLACGRGIQVNDCLTTSDPRIHAIGECCEFRGQTYGLVEPVNRQADLLARRFAGHDSQYCEAPLATRLKISGIEVFSCGETTDADGTTECIVYHDRQRGEYRRLMLRDNRLVGAILYGDASMGPWLFEHLLKGTDMTEWRPLLAFGEAHCDAA